MPRNLNLNRKLYKSKSAPLRRRCRGLTPRQAEQLADKRAEPLDIDESLVADRSCGFAVMAFRGEIQGIDEALQKGC